MSKRSLFNSIYWFIASVILWTVIFILSHFVVKNKLIDSFVIPSVINICLYGFAAIYKMGFLERTAVAFKKTKDNIGKKEDKEKDEYSLAEHQKKLKNISWLPILIGFAVYGILLLISTLILL